MSSVQNEIFSLNIIKEESTESESKPLSQCTLKLQFDAALPDAIKGIIVGALV